MKLINVDVLHPEPFKAQVEVLVEGFFIIGGRFRRKNKLFAPHPFYGFSDFFFAVSVTIGCVDKIYSHADDFSNQSYRFRLWHSHDRYAAKSDLAHKKLRLTKPNFFHFYTPFGRVFRLMVLPAGC